VPANVELLSDQLQLLGFRTVAAVDGPSALAAAFAHRPDICLLDVTMPAGDLGVPDRAAGSRCAAASSATRARPARRSSSSPRSTTRPTA
jgi:CheY-like chemotaxis protein